ncbi:MAG: SoxS protein [Paracoccus sp. (in: a-proteobacteria)]|nr:SoxS protein [Paracoccus sp. (in: a-proteobacteria)]
MKRIVLISFLLGLMPLALPATAVDAVHRLDWTAAPMRLMMVEKPGCQWCAAWRAEIGPGYATTPTGRTAPLLVVDMDGPYPDGLALDRRAWLTPTFILLRRGQEIGRIEGYPGADRFYPALAGLLAHEDRR